MLTLVSPAKNLNMDRTVASAPRATRPALLEAAEPLVGHMRTLSAARLEKLMGISRELATLNRERFATWSRPFNARNATRAILAFDGDVYRQLELDEWTGDDFAFAQSSVRILSGLYGVLRPLDLIQAYRLEMGSAVKVNGAKDLYDYWGDAPSTLLRTALRGHATKAIVNLASDEYFGAVRPDVVGAPVIKPAFRVWRDGKLRTLSFVAKRARGTMLEYIVRHRIEDPADLAAFREESWRHDRTGSTDAEMLFTRKDS